MYPKIFFESKEWKVQSGSCFVLMPFASEFGRVYDTIRDAVESHEINFKCERADDILGGGHIMETVLKKIAESEIIIADPTGKNPNVFYELGIAHMVKGPSKVILLIQDIDTMPFDLGHFRSITYRQDAAGAEQLKKDLQNAVTEVADIIKLQGTGANTVYRFRVENGQLYKFPVKLFGESNCLYDFEIFGDYVGEDGVKFSMAVTVYIAGQPPKKLPQEGYGMYYGTGIEIPRIPWLLGINKLYGSTVTFDLVHT